LPDNASEFDTVIIGAGPAGLATGACLRRAKVAFVILERADSVGSSWRNHYARLHLHTAKRHSSLPYLRFPKEAPQYVPRAQVVAYLEAYRAAFDLPIRTGEEVASVSRDADRWTIRSRAGTYRSRHLVVATGYNRVPCRPTWPGESAFRGRVLHSSAYADGEPFRGQRVLVVGLGNTGGEIAIDLIEHGAVASLSVRSPVWVMPRDLMGASVQETAIALNFLPLPAKDAIGRTVSRLVFGDVSRLGLRKPAEGPMSQIVKRGRIPLIDVGTVALIRTGKVAVEPDVEEFTANGVRFKGGAERPYDAVVLATGFRSGLEAFFEDHTKVLDERGYPKRVDATDVLPGLYFVGFQNVPTGLLREIGIEARSVARAIASSPS
jgi:indole-3-pyruvate monooxygenase